MPYSFEPIINEKSKILILETLPSITSLEEYNLEKMYKSTIIKSYFRQEYKVAK